MSTYEVLDHIADTYTPLLFIYCIVLSVRWGITGRPFIWARLLASAAVVYGLQYLDTKLGIWPALAMDYSTHTAAALSLVVYAAHQGALKSAHTLGLALSLLSYMGLMLYQRYHTLADIVSTALVVALCLVLLYRKTMSSLKNNTPKNVDERQSADHQKAT